MHVFVLRVFKVTDVQRVYPLLCKTPTDEFPNSNDWVWLVIRKMLESDWSIVRCFYKFKCCNQIGQQKNAEFWLVNRKMLNSDWFFSSCIYYQSIHSNTPALCYVILKLLSLKNWIFKFKCLNLIGDRKMLKWDWLSQMHSYIICVFIATYDAHTPAL